MSNEIGYWNNGLGASNRTIFAVGGNKEANVAAGLYTAGAGQTITLVRLNVVGLGGVTSCTVGLFATSAGAVTGAPVQSASMPLGGTGENTLVVSWPLTNGVVYAIVVGEAVGGAFTISTDTRASGIDRDDTGGAFSAAWSHTDFPSFALELAGNITAGPVVQLMGAQCL